MQAIILVGGLGTRLRPITYDVPKALVPIRNKPFLGYTVDLLRDAGIDGMILSLGYMPDPIQSYIAAREDLADFTVDYAVEDHALGTAGGVKNAEGFLRDDGPVVVLNGDVLTGMNLRAALERHRESGAQATIALTSVEDPTAYGLVEVEHDMKVRRFLEKPSPDEITTNLINAGVYVLEREVFDAIPARREVSIEREIFPRLQEEGRLYAHVSSSYWRDIGTPRSYLAASNDVLSGAVGAREGFRYVSVPESTAVGKNAKILPPVAVGEGCEISDLATVGGRVSLGRGCRIGEGAVVEGSILLDGAVVEAGAVVRGSILGPESRVGAGAIVRGLSVLGARSVVGGGNVLDNGLRLNPEVELPPKSINF
ncbi:Nucleoside-diphosphate-sugar pyrophosphorylase involved in lipopolysaccharide biosynthesis/translation initiation factor 2B gamma/epsilon subunits (eIF-2Bgamma/eIF-2Bepsilon) [Rubrobacter radiotolerans]|uniref:NDP-sugar synthase n=1 Tax=Rubrobacter radiotolerans TaxID=42256 RepID=A0A023X300_RUBRA|nr:NDP-sugar synthase [Rubrobacter radiotolerans]AHY46847.1 Nucleoside-diphosphate-sugar pyrophosphorylase involved in lipopolysaccharide biosynthesis/translation initiation factor 2B gamma/epsilon subunits (eIF-2Bgamma/eIF-2Bepsilon) [Rubrobacter radiotolerans]MDX5894253.1 NDP-sugar synthase [Rubrobacter radiotolerans]SMC05567.1 nucleotidyltransferase [Rubrobacter radiotolerans DSM 5868]